MRGEEAQKRHTVCIAQILNCSPYFEGDALQKPQKKLRKAKISGTGRTSENLRFSFRNENSFPLAAVPT